MKVFLKRVSLILTKKINDSVVMPDDPEKAQIVIKSMLTPDLVSQAMEEVIDRDWELATLFKHNQIFRKAFAAEIYNKIKEV